jgi:hypothetical protein
MDTYLDGSGNNAYGDQSPELGYSTGFSGKYFSTRT